MAKLWYESKAGGTELDVWEDPQNIKQTDLQVELPLLQEIQGLSDELRTALAISGISQFDLPPAMDLATFDAVLEDDVWRIEDILDYFAYSDRIETVTVRDGAWFLPEALISVSDENAGAEGVLSIDGMNNTWWQSDLLSTREIVFRVRDYNKQIERIRLRSTSGDLRAQVQDVTVRASRGLSAIDDASSILETGIDFTHAGNDWMEHTLASKKRARFLKLEIPGSLNGSDQVRIREIQVWVGTINHDK